MLSNAKSVQQEARELSITRSDLAGLRDVMLGSKISSENPDHVSDEFNEGKNSVADTLHYATQGGTVHGPNGEVSSPPDELWKLCSGPLTWRRSRARSTQSSACYGRTAFRLSWPLTVSAVMREAVKNPEEFPSLDSFPISFGEAWIAGFTHA